jgi:AmiR/NasT family two-component response regulator
VGERAGVSMEAAFSRLRSHARNHNLKLVDVAHRVIDGRLSVA